MRKTRSFSGEPSSAAAARRFTIRALGAAAADAVEAIELMVSELATNCIRHTESGFDVTIDRGEREIRIEVTDGAGGIPHKRSPDIDDPTGRGLQIVELLSDAWGVDLAPAGGKTVWFKVVPAPADALCGASG